MYACSAEVSESWSLPVSTVLSRCGMFDTKSLSGPLFLGIRSLPWIFMAMHPLSPGTSTLTGLDTYVASYTELCANIFFHLSRSSSVDHPHSTSRCGMSTARVYRQFDLHKDCSVNVKPRSPAWASIHTNMSLALEATMDGCQFLAGRVLSTWIIPMAAFTCRVVYGVVNMISKQKKRTP